MFNISNFLKKFQNILLSDEAVRDAVSKALFETLNFKIEKENIKISSGTAFIKTSPLVKNEIFMKKSAILSKLAEILGKGNRIIDIK